MRRNIGRDELTRLMTRQRYGIHGMVGEHFGIGVAEMVRAGCVVFAPDSGGPAEIVGDERLLYASEREAVEKIERVLTDPDLQAELGATAAARDDEFGTKRFAAEVRRVVLDFAAGEPSRVAAGSDRRCG